MKGFEKVSLKAGESKTVQFRITEKDLAFYGADLKFNAEPGDFHLWVGPNSEEGIKTTFSLK